MTADTIPTEDTAAPTYSRQKRRSHRERLVRQRSQARERSWYRWSWAHLSPGLTPRQRGLLAKTPTPCSCPMCGNPRKYMKHGSTLQELKSMDRLQYSLQNMEHD